MEDRKSTFTSVPFKFMVAGREFFAHTDLIAKLSEPLARNFTNECKEKSQGWAEIQDFDAATFDRFLEWAYQGYYTAPTFTVDWQEQGNEIAEPAPVPAEAASPPPGTSFAAEADEIVEPAATHTEHGWEAASFSPPAPPTPPVDNTIVTEGRYSPVVFNDCLDDAWGGFSTKKSGKKKSNSHNDAKDINEPGLSASRARLKKEFIKRKPTVRKTAIEVPPPRPNNDQFENYEAIFLCHAQLYVFAERYLVEQLKELALDELHAMLAIFKLHAARTGDVISLLRYAYANTDYRPRQKGLLSVLAKYVAFEMDTLIKDQEFGALLVENANQHGGDLLKDFLKKISLRI